jgi:hypothetical protein
VEKKLDRILEALGSRRHDDAESDPFREHRGAPRQALGLPGAASAAGAPGGPAPANTPPGAMAAYPEMSGTMRGQMAGRMGRMGGGPSTEPRLAELERRVADLERRLDAMERRLPRADRPGAAGSRSSGGAGIEAAPGDVAKPVPGSP